MAASGGSWVKGKFYPEHRQVEAAMARAAGGGSKIKMVRSSAPPTGKTIEAGGDVGSYIAEKGFVKRKVPRGTMIEVDGKRVQVERSNGYVISATDENGNPVGIDLRNQKAKFAESIGQGIDPRLDEKSRRAMRAGAATQAGLFQGKPSKSKNNGIDYETWYSPQMKRLAERYTKEELEAMQAKNEKDLKKHTASHLRAIQKTTSMQSNSQARAHARNNVATSGDQAIALSGALEIHEKFPEKARQKPRPRPEKGGDVKQFLDHGETRVVVGTVFTVDGKEYRTQITATNSSTVQVIDRDNKDHTIDLSKQKATFTGKKETYYSFTKKRKRKRGR